MNLKDRFKELKRESNQATSNFLLDCFDEGDLETVDTEALHYSFIASKKKKILSLVEGMKIDFDPKLKSAFDEYSEALTYLRLRAKFTIERISEGKGKSPDFKIILTTEGQTINVYAELKSISFTDNNINYKEAMAGSRKGKIEIEDQIKRGKDFSFAITEIAPIKKGNRNYDPLSPRYFIETLIEKIEQNLKRDQYSFGDTVLIIDLKQLALPSGYPEGYTAVFREDRDNSFVSGALWNIAFGKIGHLIFKPIEFAGTSNVDGDLTREGILVNRDWIKAIVFIERDSDFRKSNIAGLYNSRSVTDGVRKFLHEFCHFTNDETNSHAWSVNDRMDNG